MGIEEEGRLDKILKSVSLSMAIHDEEMRRLRHVKRMYLIGGSRDVGPYYGQGDPSIRQEVADVFYKLIKPHLSEKYLEHGRQILKERDLEIERLLVEEEDVLCS